jgi:hypothetical protein
MQFKLKYLLALTVILAFGILMAPMAMAIDNFTGVINIASGVSAATNTTVTSTSGTALTIRPGQALALSPYFAGTQGGTSNVVFGFNVSVDGTNYTTTPPGNFLFTNSANGTTGVIGLHQIPASNLFGIQKIRFDSLATTQTNGIFVTNIFYNYTY